MATIPWMQFSFDLPERFEVLGRALNTTRAEATTRTLDLWIWSIKHRANALPVATLRGFYRGRPERAAEALARCDFAELAGEDVILLGPPSTYVDYLRGLGEVA